jgi:hypothetical protein
MRALLLLSLVGIALYALLVLTSNVVPDSKVEDTFAGEPNPIIQLTGNCVRGAPTFRHWRTRHSKMSPMRRRNECRGLTNLLPLLAA